jgi:hypothetical protein
LSNLAFLNNLEEIDTYKKYADFFVSGSKIVYLSEQEPAKIHMSSRFAIFFNLSIIFNEFSELN